MRQSRSILLRCRLLAALLVGLLLAPATMAETVRLDVAGNLADNGEPAYNDYDNGHYSGFVEIDLDRPLGDGSNNQNYALSGWDISLTPEPPNPNGAEVIRLASTGEPDDLGELTLEQFDDQIIVLIQEDNTPESPRILFLIWDSGVDLTASTRFEDLLIVDNQLFGFPPPFIVGGMQFAVGTTPTAVRSGIIEVDVFSATRYVDGNIGDDQGGSNSCGVIENPCATIQQGIDSARAAEDTVQIFDAVYTEILSVDKALVMRGESRSGTIIQAAADRGTASERVISVSDDTDFEISDLTIRHGNTDLNGGGLESMGGDLLIERVLFTQNDATGSGAGLSSGANIVLMNDVIFRDNGDAETDFAGGVFLGENFVVTNATLTNVVFDRNTADGSGGGLRLFNTQAVLTDVAFIGNTSVNGSGGGMNYTASNSVDSMLELRDTVFKGNSAPGGGGGGMDTTFDTPYSMVNVLFSGNLANLGGALFNQSGTNDSRVLTNVTMSGNRAALRGGAIDKPLDMTFRNTVIWNNRDGSGTGTAEATMDDFFSDSVVEVSNSLLQGYPANEFPGSSNLDGTNPNNNPLFRDTVSPNGAPSLAGNLRLQLESPVRNRGSNSFVSGIDTDLDGEARILDGIVDLGAYEGTNALFADGFEQSAF